MSLSNPPFVHPQTSRSEFVRVRGLRYHLRRWGDAGKPLLMLGHGLLDASATFEELVQPLLTDCQVIAPDWRGLGYSEWPVDGYWFADYVADLDALVDHCAGTAPLWLLGHSMGGQIMSLYAGLKPQRVAKLILLDSLLIPDMPSELAPQRLRHWLQQLKEPRAAKTYDSFATLATRIRRQHPQLSDAAALLVAQRWAAADGRGRVRLLADPRHSLNMPGLYRVAESMAVWRQIQASTLFIDGGASPMRQALGTAEMAARRACFSRRREQVLEGVGHMIHFEAPQQAAALILPFLRE